MEKRKAIDFEISTSTLEIILFNFNLWIPENGILNHEIIPLYLKAKPFFILLGSARLR